MKKTLLLLTCVAVPALAQSPEGGECTRNDVAGVYGFKGEGHAVAEAAGLPKGPIATVGIITFNRDGTFQTKQTISGNGVIYRDALYSGTYTVNPDCTFTMVDPTVHPSNPSDYGVFVANHSEFMFMSLIDGFAVTLSGKRITPARR
jgi:hypothetical protein